MDLSKCRDFFKHAIRLNKMLHKEIISGKKNAGFMQLNIGGSDWILTAEVEWAIKFLMNLLFGIIWCSSYAQFGQFANMASSTLLFVSFWQDPISLWGLPCFQAEFILYLSQIRPVILLSSFWKGLYLNQDLVLTKSKWKRKNKRS